jgi:hypothetical protein
LLIFKDRLIETPYLGQKNSRQFCSHNFLSYYSTISLKSIRMLLHPGKTDFSHLDAESQQTHAGREYSFFENKGKNKLTQDDANLVWYADFLDFVKDKEIFARIHDSGGVWSGETLGGIRRV